MKRVILLVDDDPINRFTRAHTLREAGFEVIEAETGPEALALAAGRRPDLVLLEIRRPDPGGFAVCEQLKSNAATAAFPVLLISAGGTEEHDYPEALSHGAEAYLREPVHPPVLIACINAQIRAHSAESERDRLIHELEAERNRLRALIHAATSVVWTAAPNGEVIEPQPGWQEFTGQPWEAYRGLGFLEALHPDDREEVRRDWMALVAERKSFDGDFRLWHAGSGEYRYTLVKAVPVVDTRNSVSEWLGTVTDVTEHRRAMQEREESHALLKAFTDNAAAGLVFLDTEGRYRLVNPELAAMNGVPAEAHLGRTVEDIVPGIAEQVRAAMNAVLSSGEPIRNREFTGETASPPGEKRFWSESWFPVRTADGKMLGSGAVVVETTEQRRADLELRENRERLAAALSASCTGTYHWNVRTGRITWDENLCALFGLEPGADVESFEQFLGQVHPDDREEMSMPRLREAFCREEYSNEFRVVLPGGSVRWIYQRGRPYFDKSGSPTHVTGACIDITERKKVEEKLEIANQRFEHAARAIRGVVYDWDLKTNRVFRSEGLYELTGFRPEEVPQDSQWWRERLHPEDRKGKALDWLPAPADSVYLWEYRVQHRDGHYINVWDRAIVVRDAEGAPVRVVGTTSDVTAFKAAEAALRQSELRLQTIAETVPGILFTTAPDGSCGYVNGRFYDYTGMPAGTGEGFGWLNAVHPDDLELASSAWRAAVEAGRVFTSEYRLRRRDGEYRWFTAQAIPLRENGSITGWFGTAIDIHDLKNAQEELRRRSRELELSNEELQRFAYVISHDLQTPLRTVAAMTQLIHRRYVDRLNDQANELAGHIQSAVDRMSALITDLLEYSRVSSRRERTAQCVDPYPLLDWAMLNLQAPAEECGAVIEVAGALPRVLADEQLGRVFQNVIGNAIKYRSDRDPVIRVTGEVRGDDVIFTISDNGIGFDMKNAERVFGVFERLHAPGEYEGTGIGLAICRRIVEGYGGRMWAESEKGVGSTFYFSLRAAKGEMEAGA